MKKSNRIAPKGDTARTRAQAKHTARDGAVSPTKAERPADPGEAESSETRNLTPIYGNQIGGFCDQRLYRDGHTYYVVTDYGVVSQETPGLPDIPGQTVCELTRAQARAWLDATVIEEMIPHEFQRDFRHRHRGRTASATPNLTLGEVLSDDSINGLNRLGAEGVSVAAQVSGAVASWLSYAEWLKENHPARGAELVKAAPGILECEHYERVHAEARGSFLSAAGARLYRELIARARQMPVTEAAEYLDGLADLIEYHPALADEFNSLRGFLDGECLLGRSGALRETPAAN